MRYQRSSDKAVGRRKRALLYVGLLFAGTAAGQGGSPSVAELYHEHCSVCHGDRGDGQSRVRDSLKPPPRDFTAPAARQALSRARIIRSITEGRQGTAMVAFGGRFSSETIAALADYIRATFMGPSVASAEAKAPPGKIIYEKHCAACHGDRGNTAVWARNGLNPPPRDFTTTQAREELSRERMIVSVTYGRPGTAMMPFKERLAEAEIAAAVDYIRAEFMGPGEGGAAAPATDRDNPSSPPVVGDDSKAIDMDEAMPGGLVGDSAKGRDFYMTNCFTCHGKGGKGDGPRADFNYPRPRNFTSPESRRLFNRPQLFRSITRGKPGTVMPAWGKVLTPQQVADVAEFVFRVFIQGDATPGTKKSYNNSLFQRGKIMPVGLRQGGKSRLALGREIYNYRCYFCHGYNGDARTLASTYLDPKPRDFTRTGLRALSRDAMIRAVTHGRPGTAMKGFQGILGRDEIGAVVDFVRSSFMGAPRFNTRYHTADNGWADHERYAVAYPFVLGEIPLDQPSDKLTPEQRAGKRLYLSSCISCHDRAQVRDEGEIWEARPLSYPRNQYSHKAPDAVSGASGYALHDRPPQLPALSEQERVGEQLFQKNCAFCHGADGTGRNWIGRFIEPHPRDLTDEKAMRGMNLHRLRQAIRDGVPGTAMPAWRTVLADEQIDAIIAYVTRAFYSIN